jgi:DNA invertase Pin-like site-specific DNA recombinase
MRKIGYARVSTCTQNLDRQIGALRAERCHEVYREKASGEAIKSRPQLEKAIDALGAGDVLVVAEWDRATRSMMDGVHIIERIHARGCHDQGARQTTLGPHHAHRPRLHRLPCAPRMKTSPSG